MTETAGFAHTGAAQSLETSTNQGPLTNFSWPARFGLLLAVAVAVASFELQWPLYVRTPATIAFFVLLPGACLMACARKVDAVALLAMSIALSLAANIAAVLVALWSGFYSAERVTWFVAAASVVLVVARRFFENMLHYNDRVRMVKEGAAAEAEETNK